VSFAKLPDRIAGYATYELVEKLLALTSQQRAAIDRIVQHVYVDNLPWAPLFQGDGKICAETNYYRRGALDETTGGWRVKPGWAHDKQFVDALETAARLALTVRSREELAALQTARRRARLASGAVVDSLVSVATMGDDKLRAAAGKVVLDYANAGAETEQANETTSDEMDWWKAADDGGQSVY
jgi:hypothetical protein